MESRETEPALTGATKRSESVVSRASWWIHRNVLVREVFYVQALLIFTLIVSSIINIVRGQNEDQIWVTYLALGIGLMIPSPKVKNNHEKTSEESPPVKNTNFIHIWHKRTSQSRELFYVQTLMITVIIISSIVNLSLDTDNRQVWIAILSASYGNILPSPKFSKKRRS